MQREANSNDVASSRLLRLAQKAPLGKARATPMPTERSISIRQVAPRLQKLTFSLTN